LFLKVLYSSLYGDELKHVVERVSHLASWLTQTCITMELWKARLSNLLNSSFTFSLKICFALPHKTATNDFIDQHRPVDVLSNNGLYYVLASAY
jgi:hypothetical protein